MTNNQISSNNRKGAGVIVCNLPPELQHGDLLQIFGEFGVVISCCLSWASDQCIAIVQLKQQTDANKAVMELNGTTINNQVLNAALYPITQCWQAPDLVFIQYLPALYSLSDIEQLVESYGDVEHYWWISSDYIRNSQNALIRMKNAEQANKVFETLDSVFFIGCSRNLVVRLVNKFVREDYEFETPSSLQEKHIQKQQKWCEGIGWKINFEQSTDVMLRLKCGKGSGKLGGSGTFGVCIKNIPGKNARIQYAFLMNTFQKFGNIAEIKILRYPNGGSYGYGFVDFYDVNSAQNAIKLNGCLFDSKIIKVSLSNKTRQFKY
eukprot:TRINITY_DN14755_c0_g1_i1.p1 TRINITY_DN14755_c0_g1~~TRINITY_DN14755_c0_g1_i1.p1  ORF type:complete len:369 (-),score=21.08 TRINITY_DN14755_c0_g1_i1:220-1182(-)